ncbi:hypothetical protein BJX76DRAFT_55966 [Aspergillus varians]
MTSLNRFRNPTTIVQVSVAQGPVDCLIVRQDWIDEVAKIELADILSSNPGNPCIHVHRIRRRNSSSAELSEASRTDARKAILYVMVLTRNSPPFSLGPAPAAEATRSKAILTPVVPGGASDVPSTVCLRNISLKTTWFLILSFNSLVQQRGRYTFTADQAP